ncbi:uncharacterized protein SPPG_02071 [Spizellomyces punctatus DAOM BR117]|uniref:Uncharacterized protein n=1 Tax=Spizellomyces punctatus (strain DAOM BR117) TaxID=645134 RepID=A0A0L0HPL3_SPIPD|nr:uncharacterized protein SPPG_02071 [Spizellomyces punctatus DAOM BR117]KND02998.1 hypothetical protein SPPG_02071 [Spizellomyces punctatus DAOM BR117]|eukprot:XP_016611037.1 hypothetical protein SPPG_02071 [Spizellomyces punctatus DAOM BR117]
MRIAPSDTSWAFCPGSLPFLLLVLILLQTFSLSHAITDDERLSETETARLEAETLSFTTTLNLSAADRAAILEKYAPIVYLHPRDRWRPADPAKIFEASKLAEDNRTLVIPEHMLHGDEVEEGGTMRAKVVGQVVQDGPGKKTYLQYWFFYPVNGCQGFRIGIWSGLKSFVSERAENFEWCGMAFHNGDWEHITVQLSSVWAGGSVDTAPPVEAIAFSQHSGSQWLPASAVKFTATHPHVYSALHSHANYAVEGTHKNIDDTFAFVSRISPLLTLGSVQWIQIADVADLQSDLFTYDEPLGRRFQRFIVWKTWEDGVWDFTDRGDHGDWARFSGYWGLPVDQTEIILPPLGVTAGTQLLSATVGAKHMGLLRKFVHKFEQAPKGPRQHRTWYTLDSPSFI